MNDILKSRKYLVLDHGYVQLIDSMGTDETIIEAARMSTGKGFRAWDAGTRCTRCGLDDRAIISNETCNGETHEWLKEPGDAKLLDFLYKNYHHTPFEMCELALEVQAPIMVFREWHRHRTQSFNEFSARYAQMPNLHYLPEPSRIQRQSTANKQGSAEAFPELAAVGIIHDLGDEQDGVYKTYEELIEQGVAKEVARLNTPGSRYSKMRVKTDLRNWFGFLNLRLRPNAQWEIRQFANAVAAIIKTIWPRSYALFEEYDLNGARLSATEVTLVKKMLGNPEAFDREAVAALVKKLA